MGNVIVEYIWIDGQEPVARLRSKTRLTEDADWKDGLPPVWSFDGSSTNQAPGDSSDCILKPVKVYKNPLLKTAKSALVLCEVYNADQTPGKNNYRAVAAKVAAKYSTQDPMFGIEQEYTLFDGHAPLGWPMGGYAPKQGPFYCGVGANEEFGAKIAEQHMLTCLEAGVAWCGKNGEVMCGQWEFQVGAKDPLTVADDLWIARWLLYKIAGKHGVSAKLDPKPHPDLNGAGAHTNFSTKSTRESIEGCEQACRLLCSNVLDLTNFEYGDGIVEFKTYPTIEFPKEYGTKFNLRLTGDHETCSYTEFKFGAGDRTASVRIPLHVVKNNGGYIEDRRPCADADPYRIVTYILEVCCG